MMQNLELNSSQDSNTDSSEYNNGQISCKGVALSRPTVGCTPAFNSNPTVDFNSQKMGSNSKQVRFHMETQDADLEQRVQNIKVSQAVPPGFEATSAAAAIAAATVAAMTAPQSAHVAELNQRDIRSTTATKAENGGPPAKSAESLISHQIRPATPLHGVPLPPHGAPPPPHGAPPPPHGAPPPPPRPFGRPLPPNGHSAQLQLPALKQPRAYSVGHDGRWTPLMQISAGAHATHTATPPRAPRALQPIIAQTPAPMPPLMHYNHADASCAPPLMTNTLPQRRGTGMLPQMPQMMQPAPPPIAPGAWMQSMQVAQSGPTTLTSLAASKPLPPPPTMPMPMPPPLRRRHSRHQQVASGLMTITLQMAAMQCMYDQQAARPLSNVLKDQDHIHPEHVISQPDMDHIVMTDTNKEDTEDHVVDQDHMASSMDPNFKANRLTFLQLKTAKAMLDKELAELEHKKIANMLLDPRTRTTPYADHYEEQDYSSPLFLASFLVSSPGCYEVYICKACNTEVDHQQNFRNHHRTPKHYNNLAAWIEVGEQENQAGQPQNKKPKVLDESMRRAKMAISTKIHNLSNANFFIQSNRQMATGNVPYEAGAIEVIDLPQQKKEQDFCAFTKASQAIKDRCPVGFPDFNRNIINLLTVIYFDRDSCNLQVHFNVRFYDARKPHRH